MKLKHKILTHTSDTLLFGTSGKDSDGLEIQRFVKDVIAVGHYEHKKNGWKLDVTPQRMEHWLKNFSRMKDNGVSVPLTKDHQMSPTVDQTLGYVVELYKDEGRLMSVVEARGKDAIEHVKRIGQVSMCLERDFADGRGRKYGEAITHVAVTPIPVYPDQGDFVSIAASRGQQSTEVPIFLLAAEGDVSMTKEKLAKLRESLKLAAEAKEDEIFESALKHIDELRSSNSKLTKDVSDKDTELKSTKEKVATLEKTTKPEISDEDAENRAEDVADRIDGLTRKGVLTPALAASLSGILAGAEGARNSYMLSRSANKNDRGVRPVRAMEILDIIENIQPNDKLGRSKSGGQTVEMSRDKKDENDGREGGKLTDRLLSLAPAPGVENKSPSLVM